MRQSETGFFLVELLVALSVFSVVGLGLTQSAILAMQIMKRASVGNTAMNLAISKAEELSGVQLADLDDDYDGLETGLTVGSSSVTFTRTTDVTVNDDNSRSISVTVSSESRFLPVAVNYDTKFAPWES